MPTYEYRCKSCGENLDVVQSFDDDPLTACPSCEGELKKVFGSIGIAFRGSGFYKTDSRTPAPSTTSESTGAAKKDGDGGTDSTSGTSDSKGSTSSESSSGGGSGTSEKASTAS